ncbi:response regulator [Chitinophaga sp. LS1]|uniref:response regulator n=1 Tax=Chitinophaga sp. LS1 TaxID=3051176 RepID=UPI002AAB8BF2|nr:response regulator [Chitinophaga sp. LS1]WPV64619.1 response regulator [Chitinophaga sp. LS1]
MEKEANKVVFLIDDDSDDQEILIDAIHQINPGIMMEVFKNGRDFMNRVDMDNCSDSPSLIILDYNMPYYSGAEVLKKLNDHHRLPGIPKIIWSTACDYITRNDCITNGATNYYEKPDNYSGYCQVAANMLGYII